jgi:hypothetical protein
MKSDVGKSTGRFGGNVVAVLAGFSLLFPGLASVLCVAPGLHVEIEEIGAACCASSGISAPVGHQQGSGLSASGDCGHCIDIFLTQDGRGAILESSKNAAAGSCTDGCSESHTSTEASHSLPRTGAITGAFLIARTYSAFPLRC